MDIRTFAREILHGSEGKTVTIPSAVLVDDERIPMTLTIKRSDASGVPSHEFGPRGYRLARSGFPQIAFYVMEIP